jgi:LPS-assembly protein
VPAFSIRETEYGERIEDDRISGRNIRRGSREFTADLLPPALARIFDTPRWLRGIVPSEKLKHVIEPSVSFRHVSGVRDFNQLVRFDELELISNTTEAEFSLTHRLYAKHQGTVREVLSWQVWQRRYVDPDFGGAVLEGRRNVVRSATSLTAYSFLDGPRHYSPAVSVLRVDPSYRARIEWRADYDPLRRRMVNGTLAADSRLGQYFIGIGHNHVRGSPLVSPNANQLLIRGGRGGDNLRGWNAGFNAIYDFRQSLMQFATFQVSYNTDCCGLSIQFRRFGFGARNENQFLVAFAVANVGTFGTLRKQERLF